MSRKLEWWKLFWFEAAIALVAFSALDVALYLFNVIDLYGLAHGILSIFLAMFCAYALRHIIVNVLSDKTVLRITKIAYTVGGACFGTLLGGILGGIIIGVFNIPGPATTFELWFRFFFFFGVAPMAGSLFGYRVGKRRGFRPLHQGYIGDA